MAFDCYCAICGVSFSGMRIEPTSQTPLEQRRRWIEKRSRALEAGSDIDINKLDEDCVRSYDPRIVNDDNLLWLSKAHCLGVNKDASGRSKAFVSGPGYYADDGELAVKVGQPQKRAYFSCYGFGTDDAPGPVMPFHWCCFEILLRTLGGSPEINNINIELLYNLMSNSCNSSASALNLNYGHDVTRAQGQCWQCIPGAEYCVRHPIQVPGLYELVQAQIKTNTSLRIPSPPLEIQDRHPQNPFGALPVEIILQICSYLPGKSLKALSQASLLVHVLTQDNYFWKRFLRTDMPWFWEFESMQEENVPQDLNYKRLYLWLEKMTAPEYGMEDSVLMGAANRRRIWGVCEDLATGYFKGMGEMAVRVK